MSFKTKAAALAVSALAAGSALAQTAPSAGDLSALTPSMATVLTAVGAVAAVLIGVNLAIKGFRIVQSLIGKR